MRELVLVHCVLLLVDTCRSRSLIPLTFTFDHPVCYVSFATVGFGDYYPRTGAGRAFCKRFCEEYAR